MTRQNSYYLNFKYNEYFYSYLIRLAKKLNRIEELLLLDGFYDVTLAIFEAIIQIKSFQMFAFGKGCKEDL